MRVSVAIVNISWGAPDTARWPESFKSTAGNLDAHPNTRWGSTNYLGPLVSFKALTAMCYAILRSALGTLCLNLLNIFRKRAWYPSPELSEYCDSTPEVRAILPTASARHGYRTRVSALPSSTWISQEKQFIVMPNMKWMHPTLLPLFCSIRKMLNWSSSRGQRRLVQLSRRFTWGTWQSRDWILCSMTVGQR